MLPQERKRKIDFDCRSFKEQWNMNDLVTKSVSADKALCLICNDTIALLKEYSVRSYETKHFLEYSKFTGQLRKEKFEKMKKLYYQCSPFF